MCILNLKLSNSSANLGVLDLNTMRLIVVISALLILLGHTRAASAQQAQLSPQMRQWSSQQIEKMRKGRLTLTLKNSDSTPLSHQPVRIEQMRKSFCFGSALNEWVRDGNPDFKADDPQKYRTWFKQNFNCGTTASTLHWGLMENASGKDGVGAWYADTAIDWMQKNQLQVLGHAVTWENPDLVPSWVAKAKSTDDFKALLSGRIQRLLSRYQGQVHHWVGVNEMLDYDSLSLKFNNDQFQFRPWLYQQLRQHSSEAKLLVNEAGILAEPGRVEEYKTLVKQLQSDGAPVDILGIQAHFWPRDQEFIDFDAVKQRLDSLAELGLPIWITEFDYAHADENVRADQLEGFYRVAYAHPAVEAIKVWGFWEGAHWRSDWGTPVALVNRDWQLAESGKRLIELMNEWETNVETVTDEQGQLEFSGFLGSYVAHYKTNDGKQRQHVFEIE